MGGEGREEGGGHRDYSRAGYNALGVYLPLQPGPGMEHREDASPKYTSGVSGWSPLTINEDYSHSSQCACH